ncbi:MAG: carbamoyl-phosphate synthase large subunit [Planctomycetota bacterium]
MPKRTDLHKILVIGSGPIVIGQACEFDYSGTQGCKALREEGYTVVLVNSNPATIMTDPGMADRTYIEPLTVGCLGKIIAKEKPDAILPTLGGQTGLNLAAELADSGILAKFNIELLGARRDSIHRAEDREAFKQTMIAANLAVPESGTATSMNEAREILKRVGLPAILRPAYTLGGSGGGIAYNRDEYEGMVETALAASPVGQVLIETSLIGWKEFELEVMRDRKDNAVIVCSIENFDPMGVHTGDSITVAPAQTLTDKEYQRMRDAAFRCIRAIGVETGGSNIQFAVHPETGKLMMIEMNPRVSRSSALASKATGFPIAKFAAKLAVGYTLDEIPNDITKLTPACFEPSIDYCVVKIPRFAFEKFPHTDPTLTTTMKSVGETMAIGRTFKEALQKGIAGLETGRSGLGMDRKDPYLRPDGAGRIGADEIRKHLSVPNAERLFFIRYALLEHLAHGRNFSVEEIARISHIDPWFLRNMQDLVEIELRLRKYSSAGAAPDTLLREAKENGYSDDQLARLWGTDPIKFRRERQRRGVDAAFKMVDTCAAEFEAYTPYYYSTYEPENETRASDKPKVVILGGGPNRIGQGIEFDYCCVHASFALREEGIESIMVNSNPETVSTDYDISDRLYFEPLTVEHVLNITEREKPRGVIVQFGGQTPLNLAKGLEAAGVPILGTSPDSIDVAEDRERFAKLIDRLGLKQAPNGIARSREEARAVAGAIGYPVLVRPSFVLGGRAMRIVYDEGELDHYMTSAVDASPDRPVLVDRFLEDATEVDVDAVSDRNRVVIAGVMEHIEEAGIHSGDSACSIPTHSLPEPVTEEIRRQTRTLARALDVLGLINLQFAVQRDEIYVLEVNPRASRTVPFVSKATGIPWAKIATKVMVGRTLEDLGVPDDPVPAHFSVKEVVLPFSRFPGDDIILGPEMKSTGEVMGIDRVYGRAFAKAAEAAGQILPTAGNVFVSVKRADRAAILPIVRRLHRLGFGLVATDGTGEFLREHGIPARIVAKIGEGRPDTLDLLKNREVALVINTPSGKGPRTDEARIRRLTVALRIPCITTIAGAEAAVAGMAALRERDYDVKALQDYFSGGKRTPSTLP